MKKILLLIVAFSLSYSFTFGQSITPLTSSDYCPQVNTTFTVTLAGTGYSGLNVSSVLIPGVVSSLPVVIQQPFNVTTSGGNTVFNFVGYFTDNNSSQTFQVGYTLYGQLGSANFTYQKIRSFFTPDATSTILPTPSSITANRCQIQNFTVSFNTVQF